MKLKEESINVKSGFAKKILGMHGRQVSLMGLITVNFIDFTLALCLTFALFLGNLSTLATVLFTFALFVIGIRLLLHFYWELTHR